MAEQKVKGILLDLEQKIEADKSVIQLFVKTKKGVRCFEERNFDPYFYVILEGKKHAQELAKQPFGEQGIVAQKVEARPGLGENVFALSFKSTQELTAVRKDVRQLAYVKDRREYDIPFTRRYAFDKGLKPLSPVELTVDGGQVKSIKELPAENVELNMLSLDIETYSPQRFPNPREDPVIMVALADSKEQLVLTTKQKASALNDTLVFKDEKEMLEKMVQIIKEKKPDALVTYNGDKFDLPYLLERCRQLKVGFGIGFEESEPRAKKSGEAVKIKGLLHLDAFQMIRLLSRLGVFHLVKMDLESVYGALFGVDKEKISPEKMTEIWESGLGIERLVEYNREDAFAALRMAQKYFSIVIALSAQTKMNAFDVLRSSASNLVESLLLGKAHQAGRLAPNKPFEEQVRQRLLQDPFEGGFVKEPLPGLHERIAVLDFRSLYPSMIISHNISPETIDCAHETCKTGQNLAPTKHWFCEQEPGLLGSVLKEILDRRIAIKQAMKKMGKDSAEFELANAEQYALKILLNSHYGYLAYARSRWYSRECASAITSWAKHYIQDVNEQAEKDGFKALYSDTDSAFLLVPEGKDKKDVKAFAQRINDKLPGNMELEFEGFFKRGIFVTKKEGGAAKKRYALIDFDDNLKIVGFEYVRRDWSVVAKETQRKVIELILKEGKSEKAVEFVRKVIEQLKQGKTPKQKLVILTQIKKPLRQYETIAPHIAAAKKAIKKGRSLGVGSVIGFIVRKSGGKSISEKAELEEFVAEGDYDAEYYIRHQVIPAVIKIMRELGLSEEDLIHGGKQSNLAAFV